MVIRKFDEKINRNFTHSSLDHNNILIDQQH